MMIQERHGEKQLMKTARTSALPLYFTQPIGSMPRPQVVRDLVESRAEPAALDDMIRFAIRLQEQAGMDVVTDGEWRRSHYIQELFARVGGFERARRYEHQGEEKTTFVVVGQMNWDKPVYADDARFLVENTDRVTKYSLPSPFLIATRYWHADHSREAYPTPEDFIDHLAEVMAAEARALVEVGIDIVQIDDPALTYFCDRELMAGQGSHDERLRREWEPDRQIPRAVEAINRITEGLAAEVQLHCCHSVYKRQSDVRGDYKPLLPRLGDLKVDRVNLEFAYTGTGEVSDLKELPDHLSVGMGVVDVRREAIPNTDDIATLAETAAATISPSRIALNPDCGFAPDAGEPPTIDEAYAKLTRLTEAARLLRERHAS
jgi:5-methyltetrahydropteroyltriglutamate--homocysteine methyltransferase